MRNDLRLTEMQIRLCKNVILRDDYLIYEIYFIKNNMIKAIAFDLWGCLLRENDIEMTPQEEILEKEFGNLNSDEKYFSWATQTLSFSEEEIKSILGNLWPKFYSLREEWIFEKILENYPRMIFAVASNHISLVKESLRYLWISENVKWL